MQHKTITAVALICTFPLSACNAIPAWRQMQAEARGRANITELKAKGEAELAQAESNRRIRTLEAQAKLDSAKMTAQAEVIKAQGVAQANKIMAESLGGPEGYLRWKYIEMLEENQTHQIIYIPTEAGLPVLEAGARIAKK